MKSKLVFTTCIVIVTVSIIAGCSSLSPMINNDKVKVTHDNFDKSTMIKGISQKHNDGSFLNSTTWSYALRTEIKGDSALSQLYVRVRYHYDWRYYYRASFRDGTDAKFIMISKDVMGCSNGMCTQLVDFAIFTPYKFLNNHKNGFAVKIYAKEYSSNILHVSGKQVKSQLKYIHKLQ